MINAPAFSILLIPTLLSISFAEEIPSTRMCTSCPNSNKSKAVCYTLTCDSNPYNTAFFRVLCSLRKSRVCCVIILNYDLSISSSKWHYIFKLNMYLIILMNFGNLVTEFMWKIRATYYRNLKYVTSFCHHLCTGLNRLSSKNSR